MPPHSAADHAAEHKESFTLSDANNAAHQAAIHEAESAMAAPPSSPPALMSLPVDSSQDEIPSSTRTPTRGRWVETHSQAQAGSVSISPLQLSPEDSLTLSTCNVCLRRIDGELRLHIQTLVSFARSVRR
jgi:hypothetical protein